LEKVGDNFRNIGVFYLTARRRMKKRREKKQKKKEKKQNKKELPHTMGGKFQAENSRLPNRI
jgi:hypothetical protein